MNLYLISQSENNNYATFDSAVVAAETPELAQHINPSSSWGGSLMMQPADWENSFNNWCSSPSAVEVKLIGVAEEGTRRGVICASFNAG